MPTGRLGAVAVGATTNTTVYTCPADTFSVVTVSICNRGGTNAVVQLALAASASPTTAEYLEFDTVILPNGVLERSGIVIDAGKLLVVNSSTANCSVVVMGIETSTL